MVKINAFQSPTIVAGLILTTFVILARYVQKLQRDAQARKNGFAPPTKISSYDPLFGVDYNFRVHTDVMTMQRFRLRFGRTFINKSLLGPSMIVTSDPQNIQAIYGTVDGDYGNWWRREPMEPFTGRGIITEDGDAWRLPRKMFRPLFARNRLADLSNFGRVIDDMLERLPEPGETVDLQPLLLKAFMNNALYFVLGYDALNPHPNAPLSRDMFMSNWEAALKGVGLRVVLSGLRSLLPTKKFLATCARIHNFVDFHVDQARELKSDRDSNIIADFMLTQTEDHAFIRGNLIQGVFGAQDTTSVLTSNTMEILARHPDIWSALRTEVLKHDGELFNFEALRTNEFIQNILFESLRLRPVFPGIDRAASRDTSLPTGGGPDGKHPILVKAGTRVQPNFFALHREKAVFGPEIEAFNPYRWKTIKPGQWEYMPFGGGPRACLGREKTLVEAAYVLAKLASRYEIVESREERPWHGIITMTCANKWGCKVAFK